MSSTAYRRIRSSSIRLLLPLVSATLARGSWNAIQRSGRRLGQLAWRLDRMDRRRTLDHLRIAYAEAEDTALEHIARESFLHLGACLTECLHLFHRDWTAATPHLDIEGWEHVTAAQEEPRGALIVTGHCGNWELLGPAFRSRGVRLAAIVRSFEENWVNDAATSFRQRLGTEIIRRGEPGAARQLLGIFRGQGNLLVLIDHDIRADAVWVPFFGRAAHTAVGPAQMALRHSLVVIPAFCERQAGGRHTVRFSAPLDLPPDEREATALMTHEVEKQIRRHPAQWTWMHRRWRRRPPGEQSAVS